MVVTLMASCGGSTSNSSTTSIVPVTVPSSEQSVESAVIDPADTAALDTFRAGGITIVDESSQGQLTPGPGVTFTTYQASNLARANRLGAGLTGEQLDRLVPTAADEWPMSYLATWWLLGAESPAVNAARALAPSLAASDPATLDPSEAVFPNAVLALFVQDLVARVTAGSTVAGVRRAAPVEPMAVDPRGAGVADACETIMKFYDGTIGKIVELLDSVSDVLKDVFLEFVGLKEPYKGLKPPGKSGPSPLSPAPFKALGFLIGLAGAVSPWVVAVTTTPGNEPPIAYGIAPGAGNRGIAKVTVDPGLDVEWPPFLKSCGALFGLQLPDLSPAGGVVAWDFIGGAQATKVDEFQVLGAEGDPYSATLTYETSVEDADTAARGTPITDVAVVSAQVTRPGTTNLTAIVQQMISTYLTSSVLLDLVTFFVGDLLGDLEAMTEPSEVITIVHVLHHIPPPAETDTTVPVPTLPADDPATSCVGRDLVSASDQPGLPGGVMLHLYPNGDAVFDFNATQKIVQSTQGVNIEIQILGTESGRWASKAGGIQLEATSVELTGTVSIDGSVSVIDPATLQQFAWKMERLLCVDGVATLERTGQIFR